MEQIFYRKSLPHYQPHNATFFVTYRLADSLPLSVIARLKEELRREERAAHSQFQAANERKDAIYAAHKRYFGRFDDALAQNANEPYWLKDEGVARIVADSLHTLAQEYFELWAYCIMPNHVHVVFSMRQHAPMLYKVMQKHKRFTAVECNLVLQRHGQFWARESYDHVVRDEREFERVLAYILNNPVKAGFVKNWQDWKWSYRL